MIINAFDLNSESNIFKLFRTSEVVQVKLIFPIPSQFSDDSQKSYYVLCQN